MDRLSKDASARRMRLETRLIHCPNTHSNPIPDVAPPMHISTTFAYPAKVIQSPRDDLPSLGDSAPFDIYSRLTNPNRTALEDILGSLEAGSFAVTYSSGLAAVTAFFQRFLPLRVVISKEGYHGTHQVLDLYRQGRDVTVMHLETLGDQISTLQSGDVVWIESPQNPRGEVADIIQLKKTLPLGVILAVDSTFAPPPIQYALRSGADVVMHSSTKYLGGHSDLLGGVLLTKDATVATKLLEDRNALGSTMGNFEAWLLLRSLKTLTLRVIQQSKTAAELARWLSSKSEPFLCIVEKVWHASLPDANGHAASIRQGDGWSGVLSAELKSANHARSLISHLKLFTHATSLGGVESLIEWRYLSDNKITPKLLRISVGLEHVEDLKMDLAQACQKTIESLRD